MTGETDRSPVELATELTVAWLGNSNNRIEADAVPAFLQRMHDTIVSLSSGGQSDQEPEEVAKYHAPAVFVRKSLASPDHIISMIDGKPYRTLRRHLATRGMTPDEYRDRYGLKKDYPMVAPSYSAARQEMAKRIGLGRKPGQARASAQPASAVTLAAAAGADATEKRRGPKAGTRPQRKKQPQ